MKLSMPSPLSRKRRLWPFLILLLLVAVGIFLLLPAAEQDIPLADARKVRRETVVTAPFDGTVREVLLKPGDADLAPGTPLFVYDTARLREELAAAEALADNLAQTLPPAARALADSTEAAGAAMQERNLAAAQAREKAAAANLEAASDTLARFSVQAETLRARQARGEVRQSDVAEAVKRRDAARDHLRGAEKDYQRESLDRYRQEEMLRVLVSMERSLASENTPLHRRFTAYKAALGTRENVRTALSHSTVALQSGGRVAAIDIKPGDPVSAGQTVARVLVLESPARLTARGAGKPESVAAGMPARVRLTYWSTGKEQDAPGTVTEVAPDGDGFTATIVLADDPSVFEAVSRTPEADIRIIIDN